MSRRPPQPNCVRATVGVLGCFTWLALACADDGSGPERARAAAWQPELRINRSDRAAKLSSNFAWSVAAVGDRVHAVWYEEGGTVYHARSTDGGARWDEPTVLSAPGLMASDPAIAAAGPDVYVSWHQMG